MSTPNSYNLYETGTKQRMLYGDARVCLIGDSITGQDASVAAKRYIGGALSTWTPKNGIRGAVVSAGQQGDAAGLRGSGGSSGNLTAAYANADTAGTAGVPDLVPCRRKEHTYAADIAAATLLGRNGVVVALKAGGAYPWAAGDPFAGKTIQIRNIYGANPDGPTLDFRPLVSGTAGSTARIDTSIASGWQVKATTAQTAAVAADWTLEVSAAYFAANPNSVETGKLYVDLFAEIVDPAKTTGLTLGTLAVSGFDTAEWLTYCVEARLAELIAITGYNVWPIFLGANDSGGTARSADDYGTNIEAIIALIDAASATAGVASPLYILGSMYASGGATAGQNTRLEAYNDKLYEIASDSAYRNRVGFDSFWNRYPTSDLSAAIREDDLHPTQAGAQSNMQLLWSDIAESSGPVSQLVTGKSWSPAWPPTFPPSFEAAA